MPRHSIARLAAALCATLALALLSADGPHDAARAAVNHGGTGMSGMSDAEMQRMSDAWYARHPATPSSILGTTDAFADTFTATGFSFDHDGNTANIDTVFIHESDIVLWNWHDGSHTVTSGNGSGDVSPPPGSLFDSPLSTSKKQFSFTFPTAGTYPFFCRNHEGQGMKGVVVVTSLAGVGGRGMAHAGFISDPAPVPSRGGVSFRFALATAGRAHAEVFDVRGRRVATAFDRMTGAGTFDGAWNGRVDAGRRAASGVYYIRLTVPGATTTRRVVIAD